MNGKPLFDVLDNYALPTLTKELKRLGEFGHVPLGAGRAGKVWQPGEASQTLGHLWDA